MAINSAPPLKRTPPQPKKPVEDTGKLQGERQDAVNGMFTAIAAGCIAFGQWADAGAISIHGPNVAREAAALAMKYEKVGTALDALANVSPFANLLGAVMPLALQLFANHKVIPAASLAGVGVQDPGVLESQMRVEAQRQAVYFAKKAAEEKAFLDAEMAKLNVPTE